MLIRVEQYVQKDWKPDGKRKMAKFYICIVSHIA